MATAVDLWFREHKKATYDFLNPDALTKKTVKLMQRLSIENLKWVLESSTRGQIRLMNKGGMGLAQCKPRDMRKFQDLLLENLQYVLDLDEDDAESDAQPDAQPDAQRDAQASAHAARYQPFDHAAAMANRCRHS